MRRICVILCALLSLQYLKASTQEEGALDQDLGPIAHVKVLLKKHSDGALVEVKGPYKVVDPFTQSVVSSGIKGKRFFLYPHEDGLKWGEDFPGIYQIKIIPTKASSSILIDGVQYKGTVEIYHVDNHINVINEVDVENFLKSTLTTKFSPSYELAVFDALAIVARTNLYYHIQHNERAFWHIFADDYDYKGHAITQFNSQVEKAVDSTKFLVMTYEKKPFPTTWSANCAGKTASYPAIFRKQAPSPSGIKSPFAEKIRKESHWSFSVPKSKIANLAQTNRVTNLDLFVDHSSEKVYGVRIHDGSHTKELDFPKLQSALGKENLLSNDFTIRVDANNVIFDGYGEGHGVGLCIYSAMQMAKRGDTAPEILGVFFPETHIEQLRSIHQVDHPIKISKKKIKVKKESEAKEEKIVTEAAE